MGSELFPSPCVVVNAGTVVTVDALDEQGVLRGGLILPGPRLMLQAMAERTAALRIAPGRVLDFPTSTPDALATGACRLARDPKSISLLEIYQAVGAPPAFSIHRYSEQKSCTVSCHIKAALEKALDKTQHALETSLADISLARIVADVQKP